MAQQRAFLAGALLLAAVVVSTPHAATVTIAPATTYQTMDGFGAAIANWLIPHNNNQSYCNQLVDDLGLTIMRIMMCPEFEAQNDNSDPFSAGSFSTGGVVATQREVLEKLYTAGLRQVCLSTFSPPAWMKTNGTLENGGELRTDMYDEYAEYYCEYIRFVESTGLDVIAVSPQNEPSFAVWYASCVYSASQMRDIVVTLGQRFESEGIDTRIFWAEEVFEQPWQPYAGHVFSDPVAKPYGDIVAIHHQNYHDESRWSETYASARAQINSTSTVSFSVGFWNSEMSNYGEGWDGAVEFAKGMIISLRDAKMSGILYGSPSITSQPLEALMFNYEPTERYYVAKHFYRYIRPGAVMVDAASDDASVMSVAFVNDGTLSIVLVNPGTASRDVTLQGVDGITFTQMRSTSTEECATVGSVTGSCQLPASSVTTLVAQDYVSSVAGLQRAMRAQPTRPGDWRILTLTGRRLDAAPSARQLAPGLFVTQTQRLTHVSPSSSNLLRVYPSEAN